MQSKHFTGIRTVLVLSAVLFFQSAFFTSQSPAVDSPIPHAGSASWASDRFTDNNNGTVTDNLTRLVWLKNANCIDTAGRVAKTNGNLVWAEAVAWSNNLASGSCGLSDNSTAGQWRLPSQKELRILVDPRSSHPALPSRHPFTAVQSGSYWTSSSCDNNGYAWYIGMGDGAMGNSYKLYDYYVWPVRDVQ
jgi:hypothetical protein